MHEESEELVKLEKELRQLKEGYDAKLAEFNQMREAFTKQKQQYLNMLEGKKTKVEYELEIMRNEAEEINKQNLNMEQKLQ